jgi:hypothetical protein
LKTAQREKTKEKAKRKAIEAGSCFKKQEKKRSSYKEHRADA